MAQEADSYGTPEGVAAYVGVYTTGGSFTTTTQPTLGTVIRWIDQVSDALNIALASEGFETPIVQADAKAALTMEVEQLVADLVHAANSKGRLVLKKGGIDWGQVQEDIMTWAHTRAIGFVNLGIQRSKGTLGVIGTRSTDAAGQEVGFIFSRSSYGNRFDND